MYVFPWNRSIPFPCFSRAEDQHGALLQGLGLGAAVAPGGAQTGPDTGRTEPTTRGSLKDRGSPMKIL